MANLSLHPGSWFAHIPPFPGTALVFKQLRIFVDEGPVNEIARLCNLYYDDFIIWEDFFLIDHLFLLVE